MLDVVVAVAGLVATAPLCLLAAGLIKLDSSGPVLYRQQRIRRGGLPYTLLKFRTMRLDAEAGSGAVWADRRDARVTRGGRILRQFRIDEIPQLINVLKGEMSLVGPRPERPEMVETLAAQIPFYRERLLVPPGITGWAQIRFPYAASIEASRRKLQFDLYYIKHMSFLFDLQILLQTFRTIIEGSRHSEDAGSGPGRTLTVLPPAAPGGERSA
jgi:lipopolysaccharide/colanic/teichoic acid biosynthesis glycosyltransferase